MSEQTPEKDAGQVPQDIEGNVGSGSGADVGDGTDISADGLDVGGGETDVPASSDPDEYVDDSTLGGTGGGNAGGAG